MKLISYLVLMLLLSPTVISQSLPDSLNRYDARQRKTGYWLSHLDSNLVKTERGNAVYSVFEYYENGKQPFTKHSTQKWRKKMVMTYEPFSPSYLDSTVLLDGIVRYYDNDSLMVLEKYRNGHRYYVEEHLFTKTDGRIYEAGTEIVYFDSLYESRPFTLLVYSYDNGVPVYKQYGGSHVKTERIYLVPHTTRTRINKPRIGYTYQQRSFLELGYSKRYARITKTQDGSVYFDKNNFPGFTVSLLGSWSEKRGNYFGQKALFSYTITLLHNEIGLINYTDFQTHDLRFIIGSGISIAGRFSLMYHYSQPVGGTSFTDISRHSISLVLF